MTELKKEVKKVGMVLKPQFLIRPDFRVRIPDDNVPFENPKDSEYNPPVVPQNKKHAPKKKIKPTVIPSSSSESEDSSFEEP